MVTYFANYFLNPIHIDVMWQLCYTFGEKLTNRIIIPCEGFDYMGGDLDPVINNFVNFGYSFEKSCGDYDISPREKKEIEENPLKFLKHLILEIKEKLHSNFKILPTISLLSIENIFTNNMKSLLPIFKEFFTNGKDIRKLSKEYKIMRVEKY